MTKPLPFCALMYVLLMLPIRGALRRLRCMSRAIRSGVSRYRQEMAWSEPGLPTGLERMASTGAWGITAKPRLNFIYYDN